MSLTNQTPDQSPHDSVSESVRSRWGYHPCSYEFYRKLKYLHRHYWIALRQFHHWNRWFRKEAQNRIGSEPKYCPAFVENSPWVKRFVHKGEHGFKLYLRTVVDHGLVESYHASRMPSPDPVKPFGESEIAKFEKLYQSVKEYFKEE